MKCSKCKNAAVKNGKQPNGKQRYYCKNCKSSFQIRYSYVAYYKETNAKIYLLLKESVGITSISRLLHVSKTTVINRIKKMAAQIVKPNFNEKHQYYELDEMRIVVGSKSNEAWLTYAINRNTKKVMNFVVGRRTKRNLSLITKSILQLNPKKVFTDRLSTYKNLIPKNLHNSQKSNTTRIERNNLTLRTHLKRFSRKTICYSKNFEMVVAILKLYFWEHKFRTKKLSLIKF